MALVLVFSGGLGQSAAASPANPFRQFQLDDLTKVTLKIEKNSFETWIMDTQSKRCEGMMYLGDREVKANQAMLFVFSEPQPLRFWMKNTYIPLDIAYIGKSKKILNVLTMRAFDVDTDYASKGDAMYALEAKAGVFKKLGIKAGMKVVFPDTVKSKD